MGFLSNLFGGKTSEVEQPTTAVFLRNRTVSVRSFFMPRCGNTRSDYEMGFLSNLFGGKTSEVEQPTTEDGRTAEASPQAAPVATVLCPVSGTVMDISEVNDPVFAGKAMGDGIAGHL